MITFVAVSTDWNVIDEIIREPGQVLAAATVQQVENVFENTIPRIAELLLRDFVLAFEVASVLLLAAIIGALALVRER